MRPILNVKTSAGRRRRRHLRVRKNIRGTAARPRLVVFRSSKHIYAQLVDDDRHITLLGASDRSEGVHAAAAGKTAKGFGLGEFLASQAKGKGITRVVFDRAGYRYHGRVKAVADGARKGGLEF